MSKTNSTKILYIDDDSDDCYLLSECLAQWGTTANLVCATDGEEALHYLNSVGEADLPALIILDLNMPRWDGKQTLSTIKKHPHLASIPVVILSTSQNNRDIEACVNLGAAHYFSKPYHYEGYKEIINGCMPLLKD